MKTTRNTLKALLVAAITLVLTVLIMGFLGAVGVIELTVALLLSVAVFTLQVRQSHP